MTYLSRESELAQRELEEQQQAERIGRMLEEQRSNGYLERRPVVPVEEQKEPVKRLPTKWITCPRCEGTLLRGIRLVNGVRIEGPCDCDNGVRLVANIDAWGIK